MLTASQSIRDIVTAAPFAAAVLERFGIDLCSQADTELVRVCTQLQLSVDQVLEKLADAGSQATGAISPDFDAYSLTRLIQHIVRTHHQTVRQELPRFVEFGRSLSLETARRPWNGCSYLRDINHMFYVVIRCILNSRTIPQRSCFGVT